MTDNQKKIDGLIRDVLPSEETFKKTEATIKAREATIKAVIESVLPQSK
jgi:hypothetical protein